MKTIVPAKRTKYVKYAIRDLVVEAKKLEKKGKKILYLNIGDPIQFDFETPKHMINAVFQNQKKFSSYCDSLGIGEAKEAIAKNAAKKGINVIPEDVIVTNGVSESINFCIGALMNPGENILTPCPTYPLYSAKVSFYQGIRNEYFLDEEDGWQPDIEDMEKKINDKTKALLINNPNNPTGSVYNKKTLKKITDIAASHNLLIFSDEVYDQLIFDDETHYSIASLTDEVPVITFNGLSKNYLVPGWRVGWLIFTDPTQILSEYKEAIAKLARSRLCPVHPQQYAIKAALEGPQDHINKTIQKLKQRRDFTFKRLNEIKGISCVKPKGAFYAFPRINLPIKSDEKFVLDVLNETGVLFVHGSGFGQKPDTFHFRVVFLPEMKVLEKAYNQLEDFIKKHY